MTDKSASKVSNLIINNLNTEKEIKVSYIVMNLIAGIFFGFAAYLLLSFLNLGFVTLYISAAAGLVPSGRYLRRRFNLTQIILSVAITSVIITAILVIILD